MSMHDGMDLSRFKKVASDGKTSTLRHAKGHEIKVAHDGLSPRTFETIKAMPVHLADGDLAQQPVRPALPVAAKPEGIDVDVIGRRHPPTPAELDAESAKIAQDIKLGHIQPETMHSLYAKKDTPGKLSTLFGLLVSGAGSGLAHQPNAVLEMMQKQIDNDLAAQKASGEGARNWYNMALQHEMNQAQIKRWGVESAKTRAETSELLPAQAESLKAGAAHSAAGAGLQKAETEKTRLQSGFIKDLGDNTTNTGMQSHALDMFQKQIVNKMPPGKARNDAQAVLDSLTQATAADIAARNHATAVKANQEAAAAGSVTHAVDWDKLKKLNAGASSGVPIPGLQEAKAEGNKVEEGRELMRAYIEAYQKLDKMALAGKPLEQYRKTLIAPLVGRMLKHQTGSGADPAAIEAAAQNYFPDATDWEKTRTEKLATGIEHFRGLEQGFSGNLKTFGAISEFPFAPGQLPPLTKGKERSLDRKIVDAVTGPVGAMMAGEKKETKKKTLPKGAPEGSIEEMDGHKYERVKGGWKRLK